MTAPRLGSLPKSGRIPAGLPAAQTPQPGATREVAMLNRNSRRIRARKELPTQKQILGQADAENALRVLKSRGADREQVLAWLRLVILAARFGRLEPWATLSGKPKHSLKRFPKRLHAIADELEQVSRHPAFQPGHLVHLGTLFPYPPDWQLADRQAFLRRLRKDFRMLSSNLRAYADLIKLSFTLTAAGIRRYPRWWNPAKIYELGLALYVQRATGKSYFTEVAALLSAAYWADERESVTITPEGLAQATRRMPGGVRTLLSADLPLPFPK